MQLATGFFRRFPGVNRVLQQVQGGTPLLDRSQELGGLVSHRCEPTEPFQQSQVFSIEFVLRVVADGPDRTDGPTSNTERDQQAFFGEWRRLGEVGITLFPMCEQKGSI